MGRNMQKLETKIKITLKEGIELYYNINQDYGITLQTGQNNKVQQTIIAKLQKKQNGKYQLINQYGKPITILEKHIKKYETL